MNLSSNINSTQLPESFNTTRIDFLQFVIYIFAQFLLLFAEIYVLAAFSHYVKMKRKKDYQTGRTGISRKRKILIALLMSVTITGIIRAVQFLQLLFLPNHSFGSALGCSVNLNIFYVLYVAGLTSLYIFLWFRQHTLYALPSMEKLIPRPVKLFSHSLLILIVLTGIASAVGFVLANSVERIFYVHQTHTCIFPEPADSKVYFVNFLAYAMLVVFQASLFFCFVYILRRHQRDMKHHDKAESGGETKKSNNSLQRLIRNCAIAASICMVTDVTILTISFFLPASAQLYNLLLFDLDYIINLLCAVFCFSSWKEMIDPWLLRERMLRFVCAKKRTYDLRNHDTTHPTSMDSNPNSKVAPKSFAREKQ